MVSRRQGIASSGSAYSNGHHLGSEASILLPRGKSRDNATRRPEFGCEDRIQTFMEARNFPEQGADEEYSIYFQKMFGKDKERQRRYLREVLSEDRVTLSVGNRALGALISSGLCRVAFTTNFDSVVEKAVAEVGERSLSAYHLEGSGSAVEALNNEEFPLYCKLHGDFRYDSLKNLAADLERQNKALSECR